MEYRALGKTGLKVSAISLGTEYLVKADQETVTAMVHGAVERGINYFDVLFADPDYRDHFGQAFAGLREEIIITGHLPVNDPVEGCRKSFEDHLARLKIEAVDLSAMIAGAKSWTMRRRTMRPRSRSSTASCRRPRSVRPSPRISRRC